MAINLIGTKAHVQAPVIQVKIGDYEFGMYKRDGSKIFYPNYIQSIEVNKINGQVNTYELQLTYPMTDTSDPNFFEKVFSSAAVANSSGSRTSREISFTYGDGANPKFMYKEEKALITKIRSNFELDSACIRYTISAVSQTNLGFSGCYTFNPEKKKPSDVIKEVLSNNVKYGLQDLFTGMRNMTQVSDLNLIPSNDLVTNIEQQENISVLSYIEYLVSLMTTDVNKSNKSSIFVLTFSDDTSGILNGPYFKIIEVDPKIQHPEAYDLDIGYPGSNYVFNFNVENDESYSIYYDYQNVLHPEHYVTRINADGDEEEVFAPTATSNNSSHETTEMERSWWAKVTQYPIKASVTIKGLLRPAVLMSYVNLNIWIFGKRHINSGLYIITKQVDKVDGSGYQTSLNLLRISGN